MVIIFVELYGTCQFGHILSLFNPDKFCKRLMNKIFFGSGIAHGKCLIQQIVINYDIGSHNSLPVCIA